MSADDEFRLTRASTRHRSAVVVAARRLVDAIDDTAHVDTIEAAADALAAAIGEVYGPAEVDIQLVDPLDEVVRRAAALVVYHQRGGRVVGPALAIKLDEALDEWANPPAVVD